MNTQSPSKPIAISRVAVLVLAACLVLAISSSAGTERPWLGTWDSGLCEDGSTIIRFTGPVHAPGDVADVGFFDPDRTERAVIAGRHGIFQISISYDGYLLIQGTITGQQGRFLTLYTPYGKLQWEVPVDDTGGGGPMDVALSGHRAAVTVIERHNHEDTAKYIILLNETGAEVNRYALDDPRRGWIRFASFCGPNDAFLLATTTSQILMFDSESFALRWRTAARTGIVILEALSDDLSQLVLLDGVRVKDKTALMLRASLLNAKTGKIVKQQTFPIKHDEFKRDGLHYDAKQGAFLIETREKTYTLTSGQ